MHSTPTRRCAPSHSLEPMVLLPRSATRSSARWTASAPLDWRPTRCTSTRGDRARRRRDADIFVNPRIVQRSDELRMVPWREVCLTLLEIDGIDLLRDEWVDVDYESIDGAPVSTRLNGERARLPARARPSRWRADNRSRRRGVAPAAMARREHALHDAAAARLARRAEPARRRTRTVVALADDDSGGALGQRSRSVRWRSPPRWRSACEPARPGRVAARRRRQHGLVCR